MNDAELRFNTALKATNTRQWNTSRNLGKHMKLDSKKDKNIEFISMSLSSPGKFSENIREISKEKKEAIFEEARDKYKQDRAFLNNRKLINNF